MSRIEFRGNGFQRGRVATRPRRNGSSLLVVLALLAITLAVSYGMVRTQVTSVQVQANHNRYADARQAAMTGLAVGLRRMHDSDWGGIDETPSGGLGNGVSYSVTYQTGDPSLSEGDPDYALYPYRVTVTATGSAIDPGNPAIVSTHRIQAVVQLVPRQLADAPADWNEVSPYTFYQWKTGSGSLASMEVPVRIEGKVRFQSRFELCEDDPDDSPARERLLADLLARFQQQDVDERPFDDTIDLPFALTDQSTRDLLTDELDLTLNDVAADDDFEPAMPNGDDEYQLYPGGQVYQMQTVFFWLNDRSFEPDPITNPLGLLRRSGSTFIHDNVSIQGTLIIDGSSNADLRIEGDGVTWSSYRLPLTLEDSLPIELPAGYVGDDFKVDDTSGSTLSGVFAAGDDFEVISGDQDDVSFQLEGHLLCKDLKIRSRDEWERTVDWWETRLLEFTTQLAGPIAPVEYFQVWLDLIHGLDPQPKITIRPRTETVNVHWMDFGQPLFVPHDDDEGLLWEIVDWSELD